MAFYVTTLRRWSRLAHLPAPAVRDRGRSCRQARRAVHLIRAESLRARRVYERWLETPKLAGETPADTSRANPVNRNLLRLGACETGGKPGQNGRPDWDHRNSTYVGALGFAWSTWVSRRHRVRPTPPSEGSRATPAEQLAVGRALVREFGGYSSWPACHRRLGLPS